MECETSNDSASVEEVTIKQEVEETSIKEEDDDCYEQVETFPEYLPLQIIHVTSEANLGVDNENEKCPICERVFSTKADLKLHSLIHTLEENLHEPHCTKCYDKVWDLIKYMDDHLTTNILPCNICHSTFRSVELLQEHMKFHNQFEQPQARRRKNTSVLESILSNTTKIKGIKTDDPKPRLQINMKPNMSSRSLSYYKHKPNKLISCPLCSRKCISHSQLQNHLASHSNERPFNCPHCPKKFKLREALVAHVQIHNKNRPRYTCTFCSGLYVDLYYYRKHMKKMHKIYDTRPYEQQALQYPQPSTLPEY